MDARKAVISPIRAIRAVRYEQVIHKALWLESSPEPGAGARAP